ncbi:MAG: ribosome-associated translation inhibitor RaiA [Candidatus Nanopelagicales bacterium]
MDVVVRGRNLDLSQRFREHVEEKLARIDRFGVTLSLIDVEVSKESNPRLADRAFEVELTCRGKGPVIRAEAAAQDKYAALDAAYGRLEERLRRAADKRRAGRRANGSLGESLGDMVVAAAPAAVAVVEEADEVEPLPAGVVYAEGPVVVREKSHASAPMTVEQALHEMELIGHDFYLFSDADSGMPSVVYRRRGYDYGLIRLQPEDAAVEA